MDVKDEVIRVGECLNTFIATGEIDDGQILHMFDILFSIDMSLPLLDATGIGIIVSNLRKHVGKNTTLGTMCKELILQWKNDIKQQLDVTLNTESVEESKEEEQLPPVIPPIKRNVPVYKPKIEPVKSSKPVLENDDIRKISLSLLEKAFFTDISQIPMDVDVSMLAAECEYYIWTDYKVNYTRYRNCILSKRYNLVHNANLRYNILTGHITPEKFVNMSHMEMATQQLQDTLQRAHQDAIRDAQIGDTYQSTTNIYKCSKCKNNKCCYSEVQTRSADEPMTIMVTCLTCQHKWKC